MGRCLGYLRAEPDPDLTILVIPNILLGKTSRVRERRQLWGVEKGSVPEASREGRLWRRRRWGTGTGYPLPSRLGDLGENCKLPSEVRGAYYRPGQN